MEEGTRNTIIGAVGLGLALSYGLPKLFPLETRPKTIQEGKLLSAHPTISEIDPDFPQVNIRLHNLPMDYDKVGVFYPDTIPFQMISQSRSGKAGNKIIGNAKRPTPAELIDIVRKTKRIQILGGSLQPDGSVASNKPHWQKTANGLREQGLLSPNNIEQMAHAPFDWGDLGLEILIDVPVLKSGTGHPLRLGGEDAGESEGKRTGQVNEYLDVRLHPKYTKVNLAKWDVVSNLLRSGRNPDGNLTIMLTDDDLFRCYIPVGSRVNVSAATGEPFSNKFGFENYHKFSHEIFRPATGNYSNEKMLNFKKAPAVVHRYNAAAVFLMPYEFNEDSTYANVYNDVFSRNSPANYSGQWRSPSTGYPEAYNQNENSQ